MVKVWKLVSILVALVLVLKWQVGKPTSSELNGRLNSLAIGKE